MWKIGPYRLDPIEFTLTRDGEAVPIQRRPLDVLIHLVSRPGQLAPREGIEGEVWRGVTVSAGALSTAIYEARAALGDLDRSGEQRWIQTVRGRGFRFGGPVERIEESATGTECFVGRRRGLASLRRALDGAARGRGGMWVIEGSAGIGKTRLVQEATRASPAVSTHTVHCEPGGPPFWPWVQALRSLSTSSPGDTGSGWRRDAARDGDEERFQFERVDEMLGVLSRVAAVGPICLVVEDIHWADVPSLAHLEALAPRLADLPVLLVATCRTGEPTADAASAWTRSPHVGRIQVEPLEPVAIYELLEAMTGRHPSPEIVGWVQQHSGGVPLLARELADRIPSEPGALPEAPQVLHNLLARRFEPLDEKSRLGLAVAALCGERFDVPLVEAAALDRIGDGREWVKQGLSHGILRSDPEHPLRLAFGHALLRDAARTELGPEQAARWHGRLAEVLERQNPDGRGVAVSQLARHYAEAALIDRDVEKPLRYALLAARRACEVFAWEDVREHARHALGWVRFTPPGPERDALEIDAALLHCAAITPSSGHVEETEALLEQIDPLLERTGNEDAGALACGFRFANARTRGDHAAASARADEIEGLPGMARVASAWRLGLASLAGHLEAATRVPEFEDQLGSDDRFLAYSRRCGREVEVDRLGFTAFASFFLGRDADALDRARRAVRWSEDRGDARGHIWALFLLCMLHELRRDWQALHGLAAELDSLAARHRISVWLGMGISLSRWAASRRDDEPRFVGGALAEILLERGRSTNVCPRTLILLLASRIFARSGDSSGATEAAREGLAVCHRTDERIFAPELGRQLARLLEARGDREAADTVRAEAIELARGQGSVVSELRARADRVRSGRGRAADREWLSRMQRGPGGGLGPHERALLERAHPDQVGS